MPDTYKVETGVQQAVLGHPVGTGTSAQCFTCGDTLYEGDPVRVVAYRPADREQFDVAQLCCRSCRRPAVSSTLGCTEVVVDAYLAIRSLPSVRRHRLVLVELDPQTVSPPTEGADA